MLSQALASGRTQHLPAARSKSSNGDFFPTNYPFPCLLNPELDEQDDTAVAQQQKDHDQEEDVFEGLDGFDDDEISSLRIASNTTRYAAGPEKQRHALVDYNIHPQHRRDAKEALPASLPSSLRSNFITPAVIGSLPAGLSQVERASLARLGASPAAARFQELPMGQASSCSAEGTKIRRAVLRGSVVAFITAGYSGKRFVFEKAKELGVRVIILDGPDNWSQTLVDEGLAEQFVPLDFAEADTVVDRAMKALVAVRESIGLDGVTTFNEFAVPLVARLAERLGLPGNPPSACDMARDKAATRRLMAAAGLPSPKYTTILGPGDIDSAAQQVGFPAVIKPIAAAASMGVVRVDNLAELREKVVATQKQLESLYLDEHGNIRESDVEVDDATKAKMAQFVNKTIMMEEYLDGDEVDCDLVMSNGDCTYGAVTDNWPTVEPYFNETGSNCPSILPVSTQKELLDLSVATVQLLGFKLGVFHVELKATSRGPRLIEVNARMGGGGVRDINRTVWGVDLVEEHLLVSCGLPARPLIARRPLAHLAEYSINAPITGVVEHSHFMTPWQGLPETIYARPLVNPGDKVVCVEDGMPTWVCEIAVTKQTVRQAIQYVKQIEKDLHLPIKPLAAVK